MAKTASREILCTIGPASLDARVLGRLEELGVSLFRINLSHTRIRDLPRTVDFIRSRSSVAVCLDTEGAQIRTGDFVTADVVLRENTVVRACRVPVAGDPSRISFQPPEILDDLREGDFVSVDFNAVLLQVLEVAPQDVAMRVIHGGVVGRNKAVTVERGISLPALTTKDIQALEWGRSAGIRDVALSFANRGSDVDAVRAICAEGTRVISKIECRNALLNLDEIATRSDALLIDRGDLSREEPIERIPSLQKLIIGRGRELGKPVYVATNLLESMISSPRPTRAEVNDVVNTLLDGAHGLVLAAETAIGKDPVGCVEMAVRLIHEYDNHRDVARFTPRRYRPADGLSFLVPPHGGALVERVLNDAESKRAQSLPRLAVDRRALLDAQQIALGTFSPLDGFMGLDTLRCVLDACRLPDGTPWPMPMLLPVSASEASRLSPGMSIALADCADVVHAVLDVEEVFVFERYSLMRAWFGTGSRTHPGVRSFAGRGSGYLAGKVTLVRRVATDLRRYELSPRESRFVFRHKGWSRIVGCCVRRPARCADERGQLAAIEGSVADGLLVSAHLGPVEPGEYLPEPVLQTYQTLIDFGIYPSGRVMVGGLASYPRYAGAREAVFTALCLKNLGCSHFLLDPDVGSEHGDLDGSDRALFEALGDLGIELVAADGDDAGSGVGAHRQGAVAEQRASNGSERADTTFWQKGSASEEVMRDIVQDMLRGRISARLPVLHDERR